ncbi:recombinase family protein [Pseudarthrobacter sp. S9]|uniref:recombinase family protein n=1 Tax=Pseudarthrobacter sp. S9 TaxID=3418421 RepID=UPI003D072BF1
MATQHFDLIGYTRVSTNGQDAQLQRDALETAGCGRVFEDKISSRVTACPGLAEALDYLRPTDTPCVWKLDRLGRSVKEVLTVADGLHDQGVSLRIRTGTLTGTYKPTGEGKFFFVMMAAFAELERDMIHERTMAGLAAARAQGRTGGRPTVMDTDTLAAARARHAKTKATPRSPKHSARPSTATYRPATPEPCNPNRILSANHGSPAGQTLIR